MKAYTVVLTFPIYRKSGFVHHRKRGHHVRGRSVKDAVEAAMVKERVSGTVTSMDRDRPMFTDSGGMLQTWRAHVVNTSKPMAEIAWVREGW